MQTKTDNLKALNPFEIREINTPEKLGVVGCIAESPDFGKEEGGLLLKSFKREEDSSTAGATIKHHVEEESKVPYREPIIYQNTSACAAYDL